ncbi:MAG: alpha/beta hydrolase [Chloroflexi bacterium]|nr:alpha/beta hydrolase [Chloroflexota bacterium]
MKRAYADIPEGQVHYQYEGSGEPLLLLHQGFFSSDEFSKVAPILSRRYRLVAPDMLGYGNSDPNPPDFEIKDYARATVNFMEALGIRKASIVGVHTGASIAIEMAAAYPEKVGKLVLYGLPSFGPGVREACLKAYTFSPVVVAEDGSHLYHRIWKVASKRVGPRASVADWNLVTTAAMMASGGPFHGEVACFKYNEEERFPRVKAPVLLVMGKEDVFLYRLETLLQQIKGSRSLVLEEADGFGLLEKPAEFAQATLDFLAE